MHVTMDMCPKQNSAGIFPRGSSATSMYATSPNLSAPATYLPSSVTITAVAFLERALRITVSGGQLLCVATSSDAAASRPLSRPSSVPLLRSGSITLQPAAAHLLIITPSH